MVPWAHPSLHPKRHVDRFSRFCTAHRRVSHYYTMGRYVPPKCSFSLGRSGPTSNTWYLGSTRVINPNGVSIGSAVFVWIPNTMLYMHCQWGKKPQNVPSSRDFVTPPEEDQTTAIGNMYKTFGKDRACGLGDMLADRQTDAHIYVIRAQYNASPPLLRA